MPQMAPLMWSYLFIFFIVIFFVISIMNYFSKPYGPKLNLNLPPSLSYKLWKL